MDMTSGETAGRRRQCTWAEKGLGFRDSATVAVLVVVFR